MGDRIAILNTGAAVEQYATPEEILREPANSFVEDFLGGERGLKRLALLEVADIKLEPGPVVPTDATAGAVHAAMSASRTDWAVVVDEETLLGWVGPEDLDGRVDLRGVEARPFLVRVGPTSSLREALDAIVSHRTQVAVVTEGDRYLGILSLSHLNEELER